MRGVTKWKYICERGQKQIYIKVESVGGLLCPWGLEGGRVGGGGAAGRPNGSPPNPRHMAPPLSIRRPCGSGRVEPFPFFFSSFLSFFLSSFLPFFRISYTLHPLLASISLPFSISIFASFFDCILITFWSLKTPKVDPKTSQNGFRSWSKNEAKMNIGNNHKIMNIS